MSHRVFSTVSSTVSSIETLISERGIEGNSEFSQSKNRTNTCSPVKFKTYHRNRYNYPAFNNESDRSNVSNVRATSISKLGIV